MISATDANQVKLKQVPLKEIVKIVAGGSGTGEHIHEEFWDPDNTN